MKKRAYKATSAKTPNKTAKPIVVKAPTKKYY